jgi:hypothetical protein
MSWPNGTSGCHAIRASAFRATGKSGTWSGRS